MIQDFIKHQRFLIKANILNSFLNKDDIEKSAQYRKQIPIIRNFKYKFKERRISKDGNKWDKYYYDNKLMSKNRIKGKKKTLTKDKKSPMEITIDKKGKSLLIYNDDDLKNISSKLSNIKDIKRLKYDESCNESGNTCSKYFNFKLHGKKFKIRISDHTYKTKSNGTVEGYRYLFDTWIIDVAIGKFNPQDVINIIKQIDEEVDKFKAKKESLRIFATEQLQKDYNSDADSNDLIDYLSKSFIKQHKLIDSKYNTKYYALKHIFSKILIK